MKSNTSVDNKEARRIIL